MKKTILIIFSFIVLFYSTVCLHGQINTEKFRNTEDKKNLEVNCGLSLALYKGNTDLFRIDTDLGIDYKWRNNFLFLVSNLTYGEKTRESYINKAFLHLRGIRKLSEKFMLELFFQKEFDKFILLNSRNLWGGGIRILLFELQKGSSNFNLNTGVGFMIEKETYNESDKYPMKENTSLFKSTNYLSLNYIINKKLRTGCVGYLQFNTGNVKSTRIYLDFKMEIELSKILNYIAKLDYRYDNNPPPGIKTYDLQIKNGISVRIAR
jgi:hypothetical protein